ncbi:metallophosphoesterase [Bosea sp. (in: a-proteobacteria)]|uniref:metallophosphoesterase family protein n=1 Tax=Bosea sp. (in: a-proteobacteria) TaxID=1871050 RepID=UPI0027336644|nr:metallophosphoesterase family protein [Bosea sp. (in: a-proteobacteria)]MDP3410857.1 metallophosphoesterase family protein [Bosea sp. (in: a-proteobacteria)]
MRIAVLADIHGNFDALEAVVEDLERTRPDLVVNLGDCLSGPLKARETADLLMSKDWLTVRGNHDRHLIERPLDQLGPSDRAAAEQLETRHLDWLRTLPFSASPTAGVTMFHAQPGRDDEYLTERPTPHGHEVLSDDRVRATLEGVTAELILCGHSHIPRLMELADGRSVFNPGSVGLPAYDDDHPSWHFMQAESQHARYGIAERHRAGWRFAFLALRYDWRAAADLARARGRTDWAHALSSGLALKPE